MVQSKLDLISYDKICNEANKFTIKQLIKQNNTRKVNVLQSLHFDPNLNPSQMHVLTPFYSRSRCPSKGPCHCPYHRMKNIKMCVPLSKAHRKIKIDKNANEKYRKTITQQNSINRYNKNLNTLQKQIQSNRKSQNLEQDKYANISHKVQCKNEEFQLFLKKNALYILSGKSNKKQSATQSDILQNFIDKFGIDLSNPHKQKYPKGSNIKQIGRKRHATIQNTYNLKNNINRFSQQNFINKIRNLVYLILKGEKHMDLDSMRKMQLIFGRLVQQKKQVNGQTDQYFKDKISLEQFHDFINVFIENQRIKTLSNKRQSQKQLKYNKSQRGSISSRLSQTSNNNDTLKQKMRESSTFYRKGPYNNNQVHVLRKKDRKGSKVSKLSNQLIESKKKTRFNSIIQNQSELNEIYNKTKNNKRQLHKIYQNTEEDANQPQLLQQFKKGYKKFVRKNKKDSSFKQNNSQKQELTDTQKTQKQISQKQATTSVNTPIINSTAQQKIDKQSKYHQIMNQLNQQEVIMDGNYLKMKKYIQRNKLFLKKMELKLHRFDLGIFIIQPTDSLITKKKKIRCLKQMIESKENQNQLNKGFYDQVMKYLDIYTDHINLVIKKQRNQEQQIDFEYRNQEQLQILNSKDCIDSLKFITLQQNKLNQKQSKLQGWISIPQYVTNDKNRLNTFSSFETFMKSTKKMEDIQKQKPVSTQLEQCKDVLIQKSVQNKCTISSYNYYWALADQKEEFKNKNQYQFKKGRQNRSKKLIQKFRNFKL